MYSYKFKKKSRNLIWKPPSEDWVKTNTDAPRKLSRKSASIGYVMRHDYAKIIMEKGEEIGDCPLLIAECVVVRKAIITFQKNIPRIIIEFDF